MAVALYSEDSVVAGEADLNRNSFAAHLGKQLRQPVLPCYGYAVADAAGVTNCDGAADSGTHLVQRGDFGRQLPGVQGDVGLAEVAPEEIDQLHLGIEMCARNGMVFRRDDVDTDH